MNLLLENWDEQRSVRRESAYAHFDLYRKHDFLSHLAYDLTTSLRSSTFSKTDLVNAYLRIYDNFGLPREDAPRVANEIETHTGLFVQAGFEDFEFSHKSLQEYLTAEFIVKLPAIPEDPQLLYRIPNELAIATAISSRPSAYFAHLVRARFSGIRADFPFTRAFVSRLLIERPDFELSDEVGAALLALYSYYLGAVLHGPVQLSLFIIDELRSEFSQLGSLIKARLGMRELLEVFEVIARPEALDGERIWHLARRKGKGATKRQGRVKPEPRRFEMLPDTVFVRESLMTDVG